MRPNDDFLDNALCNGMDVNMFFDKYESDPEVAEAVDRICLSCPVIAECFKMGCDTESWGVWGAVYLTDGKIDKSKNSHKTKAIWKRISGEISDAY